MKNALSALCIALLSACGGGGGNSTLASIIPPAAAAPVPPKAPLETSTTLGSYVHFEAIYDFDQSALLIGSGIHILMAASPISARTGDLIEAYSQFEVMNNSGQNIGIGHYILMSRQAAPLTNWGYVPTPNSAQNCTPGMHECTYQKAATYISICTCILYPMLIVDAVSDATSGIVPIADGTPLFTVKVTPAQ